jgi:hypothetical protein
MTHDEYKQVLTDQAAALAATREQLLAHVDAAKAGTDWTPNGEWWDGVTNSLVRVIEKEQRLCVDLLNTN